MKIYAPVKDFNGLRNNVRFINGVGETTDKRVVEWFESHGYKVERTIEKSVKKRDEDVLNVVLDPLEEIEPDFDNMTPNQLRDYMKENGYGSKIKNIRNKEKLLEILRG